MKREEQILLYQFRDPEKQKAVQQVFGKLHIKSRVLPENAYGQKVGFLFDFSFLLSGYLSSESLLHKRCKEVYLR